jgi:hypothetical protein
MTPVLIRGVRLYGEGDPVDVLVDDAQIAEMGTGLKAPKGADVIEATGQVLLPGLVDLHTHLREPGREYAEDIATGSAAAALGGYTAVFAMANTDPVADSPVVTDYVWRRGRQVGLVVSPDLDYAGLRPRFELGPGGALTVIPPPFGTRAELERYVADPAAALADDWFAPEGHWARNRLFRFPYTRSLYQLVTGERFASLIGTRLAGVPATTPYYRPDHASRMVELGVAIVRRFVGEAERRGKWPLLLLLSEADHYQHHVKTGQWVTQPFIDALAGVAPLVHAGDHLRAALGSRPYSEIASASHHVNPEGAQLIADAVGQRLEVELARLAAARTGTITGTAAATP